MTILFTPQNGVETASTGSSFRLGSSADVSVYTIYWDSYWRTLTCPRILVQGL